MERTDIVASTPDGVPMAQHMTRDSYSNISPSEHMVVKCCQAIHAPCFFCFLNQIDDFERAVVLRLGKNLNEEAGKGGLYLIWPYIDELIRVDIRERAENVSHQEIVTSEGLTVTVDGVVYYKVVDAVRLVFGVQNYEESVMLLAKTKLREVLGTKTFEELQSDREGIAAQLQVALDVPTDPWGIEITRVELTDVQLPQNVQRAMGQEAEAQRNAKAKVIEAKGEMKSAQILLNAADTMKDNPTAFQLRFLQTLTNCAAENNKTVILPYPSELSNGSNSGALPALMSGVQNLA